MRPTSAWSAGSRAKANGSSSFGSRMTPGRPQLSLQSAKDLWDQNYGPNAFGGMTPRSVAMGVHFPCFMFVVLVWLFTFFYHQLPITPWFLAFASADFILVGSWPQAMKEWPHRNRWDWCPLVAGLMAIGLGVMLGVLNSSNMEPYVHARRLNSYVQIGPDTNPGSLADAGIIHFASDALVDTGSSAGFKLWPHTYCAAPIISSKGDAQAPVGFWAVGVDCCAARGSFDCHGATDAQAKSGLRIASHALAQASGHSVAENYGKAVRMAAAAYDVELADNPVLVLWMRNPMDLANGYWWTAFGFFLLFLIAACVCCNFGVWAMREVGKVRSGERMNSRWA